MRDVDDLLRALQSPSPPEQAPAWPREPRRSRRSLAIASGGLLLAAAVLLALALGGEGQRPRGVSEASAVLDLRMVVERGDVAVRIADGATLTVGERVLFRVASAQEGEVRLWVEHDGREETIAVVPASPRASDVGDARGLIGYRFDLPGRYVFHLGPRAGLCGDCPSLAVEVR